MIIPITLLCFQEGEMNAEEMSKGNSATKIIRATSTFDCGGRCPLRLPLFLGSGSRVKSKVRERVFM